MKTHPEWPTSLQNARAMIKRKVAMQMTMRWRMHNKTERPRLRKMPLPLWKVYKWTKFEKKTACRGDAENSDKHMHIFVTARKKTRQADC